MSLIDDLDTYGDPNDIGPLDQAPREPEGPPDTSTGDFLVWTFESESSRSVPDVYLVARDPDPLDFRMWIFAGRGSRAEFVLRASHRYSPDEATEYEQTECCEVLMEGESLEGDHCPDPVADYVAELTGAPVSLPGQESDRDRGDDSPIQY
ncbi:hypothetical protein Halru_1501 [Halovivax ruber XH-70]|uniref:Uncharacterized protein n=1 Tax=Halovivax ruber (strain DSM 18193 / JCM 13892 / XH-70) TaxID=797302 RepID=L0IBH1_HALRX|nr:hypothetical protein [Halovivax ruber]AGB16109.1 hypothetical protein Halru_1501 [Halovivax ruber XH-70]